MSFTFFWGGIFSQWTPSIITIDGVTYNCCEQYMMAQKALFFGDNEIHDAIMKVSTPKSQKALGKAVKNFDPVKWATVAKDIVYKANYAKFSSDDLYKRALFMTDGTELVEASPYDTIWGIGLTADHPDALDKSKWRGTNWLGEVLTKVRDDLMELEDISRRKGLKP